jgi:hypothetical protein
LVLMPRCHSTAYGLCELAGGGAMFSLSCALGQLNVLAAVSEWLRPLAAELAQ